MGSNPTLSSIIMDNIIKKQKEIELYKQILARYNSGRWMNQGKEHLKKLELELKEMQEKERENTLTHSVDDLYLIALSNPLVMQSIKLHEQYGVPWEQVLSTLVVRLVEINNKLQNELVECRKHQLYNSLYP